MASEHAGPKRIAVIGAGAFGTAMAYLAARNGHRVRLFGRDAAQCTAINETRRNPKYLSETQLPDSVSATAEASAALADAEIVILALPAQRTVDWVSAHHALVPSDAVVCSTAKGLYLATKQLMSAALRDVIGQQRLAFLSGPSFAQYIVKDHPTAVVVASTRLADAVAVQFALSNSRFRVYASLDVVGTELGGALKNVLAIGAGMIEGHNLSINTMAAYLTRAARELTVLCVAMGGRPETVAGLSGVGDLMLTAFGDLSRNRTCGLRLARGERLDDILSTATVEGVPTASVAVAFIRDCNLDLPIFSVVHGILQGRIKPTEALDHVMTRPLGTETPLL
mmetsp:Transcript_6082/g.18345  ORF Transcript_6082/g.18345 Transcript_6082/m.18345 type:complete len:339 (-) Transcript_6082:275-1291(-)